MFNSCKFVCYNIPINILRSRKNDIKEELKTTFGKVITKNTISTNWNNSNYFKKGILETPSQTTDWLKTVININR